jgi:hypothetical protein
MPESPIHMGGRRRICINFSFSLDESTNPLVYHFPLIFEITRYSLGRKRNNAKMYGLLVNFDGYSSGQK